LALAPPWTCSGIVLKFTLALIAGALFGSWSAPNELPPWTEYVQSTWTQEMPRARVASLHVPTRVPWMMMWRGDETVELEKPRWVEHVIVPGERMSQIAARYGVRVTEIQHWNRLKKKRPRHGTSLRVKARRIPPPREKITHVIREGETWGSIAAAHRVETRTLRGYNYRTKLEPGNELKVWIDPGAPWTVGRKRGPRASKDLSVQEGALSVGRPNRGRIQNAIPLPESPLYTNRDIDAFLWGTTHTIHHLTRAFADFRERTGYEGEIIIGAMSRQRGGRFPPHRSHQSGRDVDIRLPLLPGVRPAGPPNIDEIDWYATWGLVRALLDTDEVVSIYLDQSLQRRLYEAARVMGESHEELAMVISWARERGRMSPNGSVRHSKGHTSHIHVRFTCADDEPRCQTNSR
jgi:LysM repeat protein